MPPFDKPKLLPFPEPAKPLSRSSDGDLDDDLDEPIRHHSDDNLLLFRTFRGYVKGIITDTTGELTLRMGIVPEDKPDAFALTDFTGLVFTFDAYFRPRRSRSDIEIREADEVDGFDLEGD